MAFFNHNIILICGVLLVKRTWCRLKYSYTKCTKIMLFGILGSSMTDLYLLLCKKIQTGSDVAWSKIFIWFVGIVLCRAFMRNSGWKATHTVMIINSLPVDTVTSSIPNYCPCDIDANTLAKENKSNCTENYFDNRSVDELVDKHYEKYGCCFNRTNTTMTKGSVINPTTTVDGFYFISTFKYQQRIIDTVCTIDGRFTKRIYVPVVVIDCSKEDTLTVIPRPYDSGCE